MQQLSPEELAALPRQHVTIACTSPICPNWLHPIQASVLAPPYETAVECGPCGNPITYIQESTT